MRKIESFQMKKIYAIGHALGITGTGSEDELHVLVSSVTGKDSIKELSYQEAMAVIKRWRICRAVPLLRNHPAGSRRNIHRDQEA